MARNIRNLNKRLLRDLMKIQEEDSIWAHPSSEDDMQSWNAMMFGPSGSRWQGGTFVLKFDFPNDYPSSPPKVVFMTKMFHPNIYRDGKICLDILQSKWMPTYDPLGVLISLQSLLDDPNCDSPANTEAAQLYMKDRKKYDALVNDCVRDSWVFEEKWLNVLPFGLKKPDSDEEEETLVVTKKRRTTT